jgi:flagellar biosynthesis/type III secretory pathway protein FliH
MNARTVAFVSALAVAVPMTAAAQAGPRQGVQSPAYRTGYDRGVRIGQEDGRRNDRFEYANESEYRNADTGYNRTYGDRERYRAEFRQGFENGYREGYSRYQSGYGGYGNGGYNDGTWRPGTGGPPPWANGRGRGRGNGNGGWQRNDLAFQNGFTDGYDEGLKAGRDRQRFDPIGEGRYRSADNGYRSQYGTRDSYRAVYRSAFREGYENGYNDGRQYDTRNGDPRYDSRDPRYDPRYDPRTSQSRPWWWPW